MELFPFIKILFTDAGEYSKILPGEKRKHYFMLQRRLSINYPLQTNVLQHLKINQSAVVDFWQRFLTTKHRFVPGWMYTKGVKKSQEVKEKKLTISNDIIREYCNYFQIDKKTVMDALEFYHEDMIKELKEFEINLKQK